MAEGLEVSGPPLPVCDRYYTKYYATDHRSGLCAGDQCVLRHSNRVCVVCLAPSHPLLTRPDLEIVNVDFQIGNVDRQDNKGAQKLTPTSILCVVHCKSDIKYHIYSCIRGSLIEVNECLLPDPTALQKEPLGRGYIAIVLTKLEEADTACSKLLTEDEYQNYLTKTSI